MTDIAGRIFAAALSDDLDHTEIDDLAEIHNHVTKHLWCPISGNLLDTRTAHLITVRASGTALTTKGVIHPAVTETELSAYLNDLYLQLLDRFNPSTVWEKI